MAPCCSAWIDLAAELHVPVVRFFAARNPPEMDLEASIQVVGEMLALLSEARQAQVKIGVETHDEFARARTVARALAFAPSDITGAGGVRCFHGPPARRTLG